MNIKQFVIVCRTERKDDKIKRVSKFWNKDIWIPTHGNDGIQYLFYISFKTNRIIKWSVDIKEWVRHLRVQFRSDGWIKSPESEDHLLDRRIYNSFVLHNAIYSATEHCLYVFPISGNFFLRLPIESDDYDVLCESPYHVLCSTNSLNQNKIYYTSWNIHDSSQRNSTYDSIPLRVCQYDINTKEFFTIKTIWGPDTIHQTYHCSASSSLLCVEMPIFTQVPINAKDPSPEDLKKVVQGGVCPSRLIYIKLREPDIIESFVDKGPAHITPASSEADTVFVSCCNMSAASCFGPGRIDKYSLRSKPVHLASYEAGDLFRIPSVSSFQLNGESLLCAAVFPNQVHIINADTMRLKDKIILSDTLSVPDFSRGPYRYPNYDKTPYTVLPISESPYIALCNIWSVRILDIRTGFIMEKLNFNKDRDPLITTGHSIMIDSYNG